MNFIFPLSLLVAALLVGGCQSLPEQPAENTAAAPSTDKKIESPDAGTDALLLSDSVYSVLAGDIATQRQQYLVAYKHYLYAAKLGRHAGLAELATKAALAAHEQEAAGEAVQYWISLAPDHVGALQVAALLRVQADDLEAAAGYLRRVVDLKNASGEKGYLAAARLLSKVSDPAVRLELMRRLADSDDPEALFALSMVELGAQNYAMAETATRAALKARPKWGDARLLLIRALDAQGKKAEARDVLETALQESPDDVKLRGVYARLLVETDELDAARKEFKRLIRENPDDGDSLFALGVIAIQKERHAEAADYLERLYELGGHKDDAAFYLGQIAEQNQQPEKALGWYRKVRERHLFESRVRIAQIYVERGEVSRAREIIHQMRTHAGGEAIKLDLVEGELLRDAKLYTEAMTLFDEALKRHPDNIELLYTRALTAVHIDRVDILESDLAKVLDKDPNNADALNALGYTLADQTDRYEEALGYIQRALALKPESPAVMDSMGWVQFRLGNNQEALRYLKQAIELLPDAEIAAHLGEVLWVEGERDAAREVWKKALASDPDSDYLRRVLERFGQSF